MAADPDELFDRIVESFAEDPEVTPPATRTGGKFGDSGLKVNGKLFAMVSHGELVVKLPAARVAELVAGGKGQQFDPGHGRLMKEWASMPTRVADEWTAFALEARAFVGRARRR